MTKNIKYTDCWYLDRDVYGWWYSQQN